MLLYLPEKLYDVIRDDENYTKMANEITNEIFGYGGQIDFLQTLFKYENSNEKIQQLHDYIKDKLPQSYHQEMDLVFEDDLEQFEDHYNDMDAETKMYWLCEVNDGDMSMSPEFLLRNKKFIRLYNNFVLNRQSEYSPFLHCMYYAKMIYNKIVAMIEIDDVSMNDVFEFNQYENKIFNEVFNYANTESFQHMMYSKREQMYVLFYTLVGQFCYDERTMKFIGACINNRKFKYNDYTYFKLNYYTICFQRCVDTMDFYNAKYFLDNIVWMIRRMFENKEMTMRALNHYNNAFIKEFLSNTKFLYQLIKNRLPNLYKKSGFESLDLTDLEKRYYNDKLSYNETEKFTPYLSHDNVYSKTWVNSKENALAVIDNFYLDN